MRPSRIAAVAGLFLSAACDLPTEAPILDHEWIVPIESTTISVSQLLPAGVSINGTRFAVNVGGLVTTKTLGDVCGACVNGTASPPAFTATVESSPQNLPANVSGADLASGTINVQVQNGFSFDPSGDSVTVTVTDVASGRELGRTTIKSGLPAGQTTTRTITLNAGPVGASIKATTLIASKAGGAAVAISTGSQLTVTATPQNILVNSAKVNVSNKAFTIDQQNLDVEDIDTDVTDHLQSGAILLDVVNPFGVAMTSTVKITFPGGSLTRNLSVGSGATSTASLAYTGDELRQFLGKPNVTLTGNGTVAGAAGTVTVTPTQVVQLKAKLDAKIRLGE